MKNRLALAVMMMAALLCASVFAQGGLEGIAVYVTGDLTEINKKYLTQKMLKALHNSGRYKTVDRSAAFLAEVRREIGYQQNGPVDDDQIREAGKRSGVQYVCVADVGPSFISARILDVETTDIIAIGDVRGSLNSTYDIDGMAYKVVRDMFGGNIGGRATDNRFEDFTGGERVATAALNLVPGLGSFMIMKDYLGGGINVGIATVGIVMFAAGWEESTEYSQFGSATTTSWELGGLGFAGLGVLFGGGTLWNICRSITCHKPGSRSASAGQSEIFNFAVLPDGNGGVRGYAVYSMGF